jgi:hypothetical protein
MIALATVLLGVLLFTLYVHAFYADLRGNDKDAYRLLAWTTPPWFAVTLINAVQADMLFVVINVGMTMSGLWAWAEYRMWCDEPEPEPDRVEVLDSHRGGDAG